MAKFLNTKKAVSELYDLIRNAGDTLKLVSPYFKLSKDFKELIEDRNDNSRTTTIIYGKEELPKEVNEFFDNLQHVIVKYSEDLHAKCYLNDEKMIITSLNLYEFSLINNKEMGVLFDINDLHDCEVINEALEEIEFIESRSKLIKAANTSTLQKQANKLTGYCIRTGVEIPFNIEKPMCLEAFRSWDKYRNQNYPENYCHFSGEPSKGQTSMSNPVLKKNWKKVKEVFKF